MFVLFVICLWGVFLILAIAKIQLKNGKAIVYISFLGYVSCGYAMWLCEGVVPVMYINEQSPHRPMGRLLVKRLLLPLGFLFQLLDVGCLLHVHLVAVLVIEMVFKIGQLLVGDDSYSQSVLHLPFAVEGYYSFLYECIDVRMHV